MPQLTQEDPLDLLAWQRLVGRLALGSPALGRSSAVAGRLPLDWSVKPGQIGQVQPLLPAGQVAVAFGGNRLAGSGWIWTRWWTMWLPCSAIWVSQKLS